MMKTLLFFYVFLLTVSSALCQWSQLGSDIDAEFSYDESGYSVSLSNDGDIVAIGARYNNGDVSGHVRVYQFNGMNWSQLGTDIDGEAPGDWSGHSVSLNGDGSRLAIGAILNDDNGNDSGHVRIFEFDGINWNQLGTDINGEAPGDQFGWSVSLSDDGTIVAIGAHDNDGNGADSGHVRIYEFDGINWNQLGTDINGEAPGDGSGYSVSLNSNGNRVAVGAVFNNGNGVDSGHVRIYEFDGINWNQLGTDINGEAPGDYSGLSVSLNSNGNRVAAGAIGNDGNGAGSGHVRVYEFDGFNWNQLGTDIDGEVPGDQFGWSVSLSGNSNRLAAGSYLNDGNGNNAGHVRVFEFDGANWNQLYMDIDGEASGDRSGWSLSLNSNGERIAVGASHNAGNGSQAGHVRIFDDLTLSTPLINETYLKIKLYPNPAGEVLSVALESGLGLQALSLYNLKGKLLASSKTGTLSTAHLSEGVYMAVIELSGHKKLIRKVVIGR